MTTLAPSGCMCLLLKKDIDFLLFCDFVKSTNILLSNIRDSFENVYVFFNPDKGESFILSCLLQIWACLERGFLIHIPVPFLRESRILNFSRKE